MSQNLECDILPFKNWRPVIAEGSFIAPGAKVIGNVEIGLECGIWYGCILRGDVNEIRIGNRVNIQDGTVIHVATHGQGSYIADGVSIGHMALIHACTIGERAFIGMKACVMDGAVVEPGAMVAAGALVTPGKVVKSGQLWAGSPARFMRDLNDEDRAVIEWTEGHYVKLAADHAASIAQA